MKNSHQLVLYKGTFYKINNKYGNQIATIFTDLLDFILELLFEGKGGHMRSSYRDNNRQLIDLS